MRCIGQSLFQLFLLLIKLIMIISRREIIDVKILIKPGSEWGEIHTKISDNTHYFDRCG